MLNRIFCWIWHYAEHAVWSKYPPRAFWTWLLNLCDRRAGYYDGTPAETSGIGLGITKQPGETWLEAALAAAKPYGLEQEVREDYESFVRQGQSDEDAALHACMEWDVAMLFVDGKPAEPPVRVWTGDPNDSV